MRTLGCKAAQCQCRCRRCRNSYAPAQASQGGHLSEQRGLFDGDRNKISQTSLNAEALVDRFLGFLRLDSSTAYYDESFCENGRGCLISPCPCKEHRPRPPLCGVRRHSHLMVWELRGDFNIHLLGIPGPLPTLLTKLKAPMSIAWTRRRGAVFPRVHQMANDVHDELYR